MWYVKQQSHHHVLWAAESTDDDGFAIPSWTRDRESALRFNDPADAVDVATERHRKGQHLNGYDLVIVCDDEWDDEPITLDGCTCGGIGTSGAHRHGCQWAAR